MYAWVEGQYGLTLVVSGLGLLDDQRNVGFSSSVRHSGSISDIVLHFGK